MTLGQETRWPLSGTTETETKNTSIRTANLPHKSWRWLHAANNYFSCSRHELSGRGGTVQCHQYCDRRSICKQQYTGHLLQTTKCHHQHHHR